MSRCADRRASSLALSCTIRELWSPETPDLYDVTFELRRGAAVLDRVNPYFGFRSVAVGRRPDDAQRPADLPEDGARSGLLAGKHAHAAHPTKPSSTTSA